MEKQMETMSQQDARSSSSVGCHDDELDPDDDDDDDCDVQFTLVSGWHRYDNSPNRIHFSNDT